MYAFLNILSLIIALLYDISVPECRRWQGCVKRSMATFGKRLSSYLEGFFKDYNKINGTGRGDTHDHAHHLYAFLRVMILVFYVHMYVAGLCEVTRATTTPHMLL